jgi:hypothetical protein
MPRRSSLAAITSVLLASLAWGLGRAAPLGPVPFHYDLYTFRGDHGGTTDVVAAFAVPAGNLQREDHAGRTRYRFDVTLVLSDTVLGSLSRTDDSVFVALARPLAGEHLLHTHIQVGAAPSESTVQRVILSDATTPGMGQLYSTPYVIPDYSGSGLMLSDVAFALPGAQGGWTRGDVSLALLPTSQFPQGSFEIYYEIYNLPGATRYATEVAVERVADPRGQPPEARLPVQARFTGEAATLADGSVRELRRVDATLPRGSYRLTVTVTDLERGASATRSRIFQVRGWLPGTTLVRALRRESPP